MPNNPTQQIVNIAGIKDGIIILRDGGYRLVFEVSTVNFSLKSEQEQNSLIFQYQSFLNSLHFPIEIVMRSKKLDLNFYLKKIKKLAEKQENELLKIQTEDYVDFVGKLIDLANIMKKSFFVAIPFQPITIKAGVFSNLFNKEKTFTELRISEAEFKRNSDELRERAKIIASGLAGLGLHCVQLSTEEIIELFYQVYNPEVASKEIITDANDLAAPIVGSKHENPAVAAVGSKLNIDADSAEGKIDNHDEVMNKQKEKDAFRQREVEKEVERTGLQQVGAPVVQSTASKIGQQAPAASGQMATGGFNQVPAAPPATKEEFGKPQT